MKNFCIIFLSFVIIILTVIGFTGALPNDSPAAVDYLRIHIRANSNEEDDQAVKYAVRNEIVEYLTPLIVACESKTEALQAVRAQLPALSEVAKGVLQSHGFSYGAKTRLDTERFPTRAYGEYVLPAGEYSALILDLGSGSGDNWWCVVYPPLCFTGGENVVYKSKIKEIIERFYKN